MRKFSFSNPQESSVETRKFDYRFADNSRWNKTLLLQNDYEATERASEKFAGTRINEVGGE